MLSSYDITTELQKRNAIFEVNQQIILSGLYNGGFFNEAAFYGGTCLRIFHGLHRFSEDMDFSLLAPNENFDFTHYFQPIIDDTTRQDNVFDAPAVKKRVQVYVYGTLVHTGEKRCFYYVIYLGPISTR
jgi:predicted nucleotidyltransferase component of viral defense system